LERSVSYAGREGRESAALEKKVQKKGDGGRLGRKGGKSAARCPASDENFQQRGWGDEKKKEGAALQINRGGGEEWVTERKKERL